MSLMSASDTVLTDRFDRAPEASDGWAADAEATMLDRLRAKDERAFEMLVRAYGGRMLAVARRLLRSEDDAADAVQEAFLAAFKSIDRFRGAARLSTWLHRIVVNAVLMKLRASSRRPEETIEDLLHASMPTAISSKTSNPGTAAAMNCSGAARHA